MSEKGIEINSSQNRQITISSHGVEIRHRGKPVSSVFARAGYAYLLIDCSGSMAGDKLNQAKRGASRFATDALSKGYYTGLIQFDTYASLLAEPTKEISLLERCLSGVVVGGSTNMAEAIILAHRQLTGKAGFRAIVIVTDGMPDSVDDSLKAGKDTKKDGIDIITIGTDDADQKFLKKLSSRADLGIKVSREHFEQSIASSVKMLPTSGRKETRP
jgi:Mg-chelatase subunit ChlD